MPTKTMRSSPFTIYADSTSTMAEQQTSSPSPYDADASISSDDIEHSILPSIESPLESRKYSATYTTVSSIPPSLPYNSDIKPYTPRKGTRPAFRSPSSVRALQMASPPPFPSPRPESSSPRRYESSVGSPMSARRYRPETPRSLSGSVRRHDLPRMVQHPYEHTTSSQRSHASERSTPAPHEQTPQRTGPLVLLHITLLPCSSPPYSAHSMTELAPANIVENWRLLKEKLSETVLDRGLLISHPGEEYDLLEERVLETLDLCVPRITACGHYYGGDSDSDSGNDSGVSDLSGKSGGVRAICDEAHGEEDEDVCHQCDQPMHLPGKGVGNGSRRWNVKIFAANGLMRAGAWAAAWREMERVDVEIEPWMPEQVKRDLDARLDQEEEEERRQAEEVEQLKFDLREMERLRLEAEAARLRAEECAKEMDEELKRMSVVKTTPLIQPLATPALELLKQRPTTPVPTGVLPEELQLRGKDIPLSTLLYNYVYLLAQDRRNWAVSILSILVLLFSFNLATSKITPSLQASHELHVPIANISMPSQFHVSSSASPTPTTQAPDSLSAPVQPHPSDKPDSSPSVYSPPASESPSAPRIPRIDPHQGHQENPETSLKPQPHSQEVSQASLSTSSPTTSPSLHTE